ncbi:SCO family protein [Paenibacillus alkalitolerans]|uniref:SCO family protein n=1 Tax=Paenibacillus alkalitolerans TaxID=2799335 RepID=UPI0018F6E001|nr:SCO family protein [Paenibacillus alkalitolerans]
MDGFWRKHWYKAVMAAVSVVLLGAIAFVYWGGGQKNELPVMKEASGFELTGIDGNAVSLENTEGKARILYFFFANCPDVCPTTTHMLSRVQERLKERGVFGTDALFLQATIDPQRDTPESLKKYADAYGADLNGWKFLRGTEQQVHEVAQSYGITVIDDNKGNFTHINAVILIDQDNQIRRTYQSDDLDEDLIADDILQLVNG